MKKLDSIIGKVLSAKRIDADEALVLYYNATLPVIGSIADSIRHRLHPEKIVTFVSDRNINYTNVCVSRCLFCAFFKPQGHKDSYVISKKSLEEKIGETLELGGTQILLQGGMHPDLGLDYYLDLLGFIKKNFQVHIHGFSPPEIFFIATRSGIPIKDTIEKLKHAGLDSIPGGGAEILVDEVRKIVSPNKCTAGEWLEVMRVAHGLGLRSTATMMFGHRETPEQIVEHLIKIRKLQDETGGFTAFIPWPFQPDNTKICVEPASSAEYLKILALSRIILDNVPNLQASWVTQGGKIAQVALAFGANDMGSTMIEENVVAAAGVKFRLPKNEIVRLIGEAGFRAVQRDCFYNCLEKIN